MLDSFLKVACSRSKKQEDQEKLASAMKHLPPDYLYKLATGQEKLAYISGPCDPDWLEKFKGTPLFERAIELEKQELQQQMAEQTRYREEEQVRTERSAARDEIQVQRKLLDLELAEVEAGGSLADDAEAPVDGEEAVDVPPEEGVGEVPVEEGPEGPAVPVPAHAPEEPAEPVVVPEEGDEELPVEVEEGPPVPPKPKPKEEEKKAAAMQKAYSKLKGVAKRGGELLTGSRAKRLENVAKKTSRKANYHEGIAQRLTGHGPIKAVAHHAGLAGKNQARFSHLARGAGEEHAKVRATRAVAGSVAVGALGGATYAAGKKAGRKEKTAASEGGHRLGATGGAILGGAGGGMLGRGVGRLVSEDPDIRALYGVGGLALGALGGGVAGSKYASVMFKEAIDIMGLGRAIGSGVKSVVNPAAAAGKLTYQAGKGLGAGTMSALGHGAASAGSTAMQALPRAAKTIGRAGLSFAKAHPYQAAGLAGGTALAGNAMMSD